MDDSLVLNIGQYEVGAPELGTLEFVSKPEQLTLFASGDLIAFNLPGTISYVARQDKPIQPYYPQVIALHGSLYFGQQSNGGLGATLLPPKMPSFHRSNDKHAFALTFTCDRRFLQHVEELRAAAPSPNVTLGITLDGTAAIVAPASAVTPVAATAQESGTQPVLTLGDSPRMVVGQFARFGNPFGEWITVSRSHWGDELKKVGYPQSRSIGLPAIDAESNLPGVRLAAQHLISAQSHFLNDEFRQAVQLCRQARDALLGEDKKSWAVEHLTGALGEKKTHMVDEAIWSLKYLGDVASHGDEKNVTIEVDRDTAEYVIGQLALILHYIDRKLR